MRKFLNVLGRDALIEVLIIVEILPAGRNIKGLKIGLKNNWANDAFSGEMFPFRNEEI